VRSLDRRRDTLLPNVVERVGQASTLQEVCVVCGVLRYVKETTG
jgi:hypothetical protein